MSNDIIHTRLGLTFHRSFALNCPAIGQVLKVSRKYNGQVTRTAIRKETSLGTVYVEAMPRYARGCGLLESDGYKLTPLGELVTQYDPNLSQQTTLWLMHYHLSAPKGSGPLFWSHLVRFCLPFNEEVTTSTLATELIAFMENHLDEMSFQERSIRSTVTVFLGTYIKSDALGRLNLIGKENRKSDSVFIHEPKVPPLGALGYALADYWEAHYGDQSTVSLSELARQDGFARVMWMDAPHLEAALDELRRQRLVDLFRIAPPYQVARLWKDKTEMLKRLYQ